MGSSDQGFLAAFGKPVVPAFACTVCGKKALGRLESEEAVGTYVIEPEGWHLTGEPHLYEDGWCCGCIPEGWGLHCSGQWIKPGFCRVEPLPHAKWLCPRGVFDDLLSAILACEENADEINSFEGVL